MNSKYFYDNHNNFSLRNSSEYFLSPGIKCKFDLIWENLGKNDNYYKAIDLGCSGNSILALFNDQNSNSYLDIASIPLKQYKLKRNSHPICADLLNLPYRDDCFELVCALDVLEHVKDDNKALIEIKRILKKGGRSVISVPHRRKYFTYQDTIIGHYRRYEIQELITLCKTHHIKILNIFGVYGILMKISIIQGSKPKQVEKRLMNLRFKYLKNQTFRKFWNLVVYLLTKIMKLDAKFQLKNKLMNIAIIFSK